jgi:quercetin dioxygenase-like cupin family protein
MNKISGFPLLLLLLSLSSFSGADAQAAKETPLMSQTLPDVPGKEGVIEKVVLSPGEVVPAHRHNADVFAYVLKGSMVTQLKGGRPHTVHAGEVFYESPTDVHVMSHNASTTRPATLLVFFVKKIGAAPPVYLQTGDAAQYRHRNSAMTAARVRRRYAMGIFIRTPLMRGGG